MKIEIKDEIAEKAGISEKDILEVLAIAIYKKKGIHSRMAGRIIDDSYGEIDFGEVLGKYGESHNYSVDDLEDDLEDDFL